MSNTANTALGVLAGVATGAALGILFAPDKGERTRRKIAEEALAAKESLTENAINLKDRAASSLTSKTETLESKMENIVSDVSYKTEDVITTLERKLADLKSRNKKLQKTS